MPGPPRTPGFAAGQALSAAKLNEVAGLAARGAAAAIDGSSGIEGRSGASGTAIRGTRDRPIFAKLTGHGASGSSDYAGTEQLPRTAGAWADGTKVFGSSTGRWLREVNGNSSLPVDGTVIVEARYSPGANAWLFQLAICGSTSSSGTGTGTGTGGGGTGGGTG